MSDSSTDHDAQSRGGDGISIGVTQLPYLDRCESCVALRISKKILADGQIASSHPYGILGTLHHEFLEAISNGSAGVPCEPDRFQEVWEDCINHLESEISKKADACWIPFSVTIRDLERCRLQAFASGSSVEAVHRRRSGGLPGGAPRLRGTEVWLEMAAKGIKITGKADLIEDIPNGVRIVDFKSGSIYDETGAIKSEYRSQLLMYAGMLEELNGGTVTELVLVDQSGDKHAIDFNQTEIRTSITRAKERAEEFVRRWPAGDPATTAISQAYKSGSPKQICDWSNVRMYCPDHMKSLVEMGRLGLGSENHAFRTTDIAGRILRSGRCTLGWAISISTPVGRIYLRGSMPRPPVPGDRLRAFGVVPGPMNPAPNPEEANDFVVPHWGRVVLESDSSQLPSDWPDRLISDARGDDACGQGVRNIRESDICLKVSGDKHVKRITFEHGAWVASPLIVTDSATAHFLAVAGSLTEIRRIIEEDAEPAMIWCQTREAVTWLQDGPPKKSLEKASADGDWFYEYAKLANWWKEFREQHVLQVKVDSQSESYGMQPFVTIELDGKRIARVAVPSQEPPTVSAQLDNEPVLDWRISKRPEPPSLEKTIDVHPSSDEPTRSEQRPDVRVVAIGSGTFGPGRVVVETLSEAPVHIGLGTSIEASCSSHNILCLIGLLETAKSAVEHELEDLTIDCSNTTAITWLGSPGLPKKFDPAEHDEDTVARLEELVEWWVAILERDSGVEGGLELKFVKGNPATRVTPVVVMSRNSSVIFECGRR